MWSDAEDLYIERFKPPGRDVIRDLSVKGITEASDVIKMSEKNQWNRQAKRSAFEFTLPPAHAEQIMRESQTGRVLHEP